MLRTFNTRQLRSAFWGRFAPVVPEPEPLLALAPDAEPVAVPDWMPMAVLEALPVAELAAALALSTALGPVRTTVAVSLRGTAWRLALEAA